MRSVNKFKVKLDALLSGVNEYIGEDGQIFKNKVIELAIANDKSLITLLLSDDEISRFFFS